MSGIVSVLETKLGPSIEGSGDEVRFNCFRPHNGRPDEKHHLYLNVTTKRWVCFRCPTRDNGRYFGGDVRSLFRALGLPTDVPVESLERTAFDSIIAELTPGPVQRPTQAVLDYPCETRVVTEGSAAWSYLTASPAEVVFYIGSQPVRGRGMLPEQVRYYRLSWGTYAGGDRVFIPTFSPATGKIVYWTARAFRAPADTLRYVNPGHEEAPGGFLFNLDRAIQFDTVILCEGPFSAMAAGRNAVAMFGKALTRRQTPLLFDHQFANYVVALDGDARAEAASLARTLVFRGCRTFLVELPPGEDPASVSQWPAYLNSARPASLESLVSMDLQVTSGNGERQIWQDR